jgi:2-polyprenyl-3-methyl-5-hydroxy-6-metoxy-1,4-benzoquinol methylase
VSQIEKVRVEKNIVMQLSESIIGEQRDESAIPSYTHYNPLVRWIMFRRLDVILELLHNNVVPGSDGGVLEFGCGVGLLLPRLCKLMSRVYATDICLDAAIKTVQYYGCKNVTLIPPDQLLEAISDQSLNSIIAADVLEHVDNLEEIVRIFRAKLAPQGSMIISGPTENVIYGICRKIAGFTGEYHVRNIFDIEQVAENVGFHLVEQRSLPFPLLPKLFRISLFQKS